ncbi:HlyD family secretion protein [Formosa sp. PL04]|uniref:HlyD family secretion protein n=1 Tax=Formosa sp. PL04 TaxID=3081755 RepID=UPI002981A10E|nr:biotin/lipoyl-binding protein [Formosa sp. PL04]MDW5290255.1 efflux RND transporter periplasmic adaptor subunit [Formosa sp. PL04]
MKNSKSIKTIVGILVLAILVLVSIWLLNKPKDVVFQGRIEAKEIYLSAKIPSRLKTIEVKEGTSVLKGQLLATLESPEIDAKEQQALAAKDAATAQQSKAINGARAEEINAYKSVYEKAILGADLMIKSYDRIENLFKDGVVSEQQRDEVLAKKNAALKDQDAAYDQYQIALKGARKEDIAAANALVKRAEGALNELESYKSEQFISSPIDAEVMDFLPEEGELIGAGYPVVHLVDLSNAYAVVNVKETSLFNFEKGSEFTATIPALQNITVTFKIYYVAALGDYATWNATKTTGDFDIRTFEIKASPVNPEIELRPGMSILIDAAQFKN